MLESHFTLTGYIRVPTGEYSDGKPTLAEHSIKYVVFDGSYRHPQTGALQAETTYYIKPVDESTFPESIPPESKFIDCKGREFDIATATRYYRSKEQKLEAFAVTLVSHGRRY